MTKERCFWAGNDPLYIDYHDAEWGVPLHDDRALFEFLILEGTQAGLSWLTILKKRAAYREAFDQFDVKRVASYDDQKVAELLGNAGIVRNRLKIRAAIKNAQAVLVLKNEFRSLDEYLWGFVNGKVLQNRWRGKEDIPARTAESDALSKDLVKHGFTFVGSTICYALMQATGMVNDHAVTCFRHRQLGGKK